MQSDVGLKYTAPVISVIMGVYNGERFLHEAIDSVLNQTYGNFEFIICDDCSEDRSVEILREYAERDSRIVLLQNDHNLGLAATLNKCLSIARAELIARMDCDDRSLPDRFARQMEWMRRNPQICALGSGVEYIDDNGCVFGRSDIREDCVYVLEDTVKRSVLVHPSVMMRKVAVAEVGFYTVNELTTRAEDYDLWCKLCENGGIIANTSDVLFQYREDESSIVKRKYIFRIQEFRLKWYWVTRAKRPVIEVIYAIKPLIVGLLPLGVYKVLHRRKLTGMRWRNPDRR